MYCMKPLKPSMMLRFGDEKRTTLTKMNGREAYKYSLPLLV